jgi:putative endonuclease
MKTYYVYILASQRNGTLYIGVTDNLKKRTQEHKTGANDGFTKKYSVHTLVWYDTTPDIASALVREKQIKKWERKWKLRIIEEANPMWKDLSAEF